MKQLSFKNTEGSPSKKTKRAALSRTNDSSSTDHAYLNRIKVLIQFVTLLKLVLELIFDKL